MSTSRSIPTRPWRGASADDRRAERRARLIEAGLELIGTSGWPSATVRAVSRQAGLTARYLYEAFPVREDLLVAVFEQVRDETMRAIVEAFLAAPPDARSRARAAIAAGLGVLTEDPRKGRVLLLEAQSDPRLQEQRQLATIAAADMLVGIAHEHFDAARRDPTDVQLCALSIVGAETELVTAYLAGRLEVTRERLIDHITELHLAAVAITST